VIHSEYPIEAGEFTHAGEASVDIKRKLKQLGVSNELLRRVSVASYELEMNIVIHSLGGYLSLDVDSECVKLSSQDRGPGIPDIEQAMSEGFSTAGEEARTMGFGAGMGLPNMKRNADVFMIDSQPGVGTTIDMMFELR
jgi:serine/threonine-protein kinase RsbT